LPKTCWWSIAVRAWEVPALMVSIEVEDLLGSARVGHRLGFCFTLAADL
jgi:hypothetical protein